jgi:hypothetical protein
MLSAREDSEIRDRTFRTHCLDIQLTSRSDRFPSYSGPGSIRLNDSGTLVVELYDQVQKGDPTLQPGTNVGPVIPLEHYYQMRAVDLSGRSWTADRLLPRHGGRVSQPGVVVTAAMAEMQCAEESHFPPRLQLFIPGKFETPVNRVSHVIHRRSEGLKADDDEEIGRSTALDTWVVDHPTMTFTLTVVKGGLEVTAEPKGRDDSLPAGLDTRIEEALWLVLAHPCRWLVKMGWRESVGSTAIRSHRWSDVKSNLDPPIHFSTHDDEDAAELFKRYLDYVLAYGEARYHPTSVNVLQVLRASAQSIEAEALGLGVAIESVLNREYAWCGEPPASEQQEVDALLRLIADSGLSDRVKERARGALGRMKSSSADGRLRTLEREGHIRSEWVDAWRRIRHATTHGSEMQEPFEETIRLCNQAYTLFARLIFSRIGFTGRCEERRMGEWRTVPFKPFWSPPPATALKEQRPEG